MILTLRKYEGFFVVFLFFLPHWVHKTMILLHYWKIVYMVILHIFTYQLGILIYISEKCYSPWSRMNTMPPDVTNLRPSNMINSHVPPVQQPTHSHIQSCFLHRAGCARYLPSKLPVWMKAMSTVMQYTEGPDNGRQVMG